jgi:hypothetical protein
MIDSFFIATGPNTGHPGDFTDVGFQTSPYSNPNFNIGVRAEGTQSGVTAISPKVGVLVHGDNIAVAANGGNYGLYSFCPLGVALQALTDSGTAIDARSGLFSPSNGTAVYALSNGDQSTGMIARASGRECFGLFVDTTGEDSVGIVVETRTTTGRRAIVSRGEAALFYGNVTVHGGLTVVGPKSALVQKPDGSYRQLYCVESPESWFEDFGIGRLLKGKAKITLDPEFAQLVRVNDYHVFATPESDCNGLFITKKSSTAFEVRELQGGSSSAKFSYRIVARRKDITVKRLAKTTPPKTRKAPAPPKLAEVSPSKKATKR